MFGKLIKITNNMVITFLTASQKPVFWDTISNLFFAGHVRLSLQVKGTVSLIPLVESRKQILWEPFFLEAWTSLSWISCIQALFLKSYWLGAASFNMTQRSKIISQNKRFSSASVSECHISFYCVYILLS